MELTTKSGASCRPCPIRQNDSRNPSGKLPADSRPAYERAAMLRHGKLLWYQHCFASQIIGPAATHWQLSLVPRAPMGFGLPVRPRALLICG